MDQRSGLGFDVHRFGGLGPVVLGGVRIESERGLVGHSDADVLAHAVADAVLGAAGLGDLGVHFPQTDPAHAGADSLCLLAEVVRRAAQAGWKVTFVDATVVCESPRIGPHRSAMAANLAGALGIDTAAVSVKATTTEGLGSLGRGEGIACLAVATLCR
jgi:2-C-methyl-D-erythritol 2,4-cyclodiphosphate synthase